MSNIKERVSGGKASGGGAGTPATEARQIEEEEIEEEIEEEPQQEPQQETRQPSEAIFRGDYVIVRKRKGFFNAYIKNNPDKSLNELTALALNELLQNRNKIKADGIIWLNGPGFRLGVPSDRRVLVAPAFNKKAILLDNLISFMKYMTKEKK